MESIFRELNSTNETTRYNPDEVSEFPVTERRFDRQPHNRHSRM